MIEVGGNGIIVEVCVKHEDEGIAISTSNFSYCVVEKNL